jgi:hypothetical protein
MSYVRIKEVDFVPMKKKVEEFFRGNLTNKTYTRDAVLNLVTVWALNHEPREKVEPMIVEGWIQ